jgi:hypothetical protein
MGLCPESDESRPHRSDPTTLKSVFIIFFHLCPDLPSNIFLSDFLTKHSDGFLVFTMRNAFLNVIASIIFGGGYIL